MLGIEEGTVIVDACIPFDGTVVCPTCRFPQPEAPEKSIVASTPTSGNAEYNPEIGPYGAWTYKPTGFAGVDSWASDYLSEEEDGDDDKEAEKDYKEFKEMLDVLISGFKTEYEEKYSTSLDK